MSSGVAEIAISAPWSRRWLRELGIPKRLGALTPQGWAWMISAAELEQLEAFLLTRSETLATEHATKRSLHRAAMSRSMDRRSTAHRRRRARYDRVSATLVERHRPRLEERARQRKEALEIARLRAALDHKARVRRNRAYIVRLDLAERRLIAAKKWRDQMDAWLHPTRRRHRRTRPLRPRGNLGGRMPPKPSPWW